jgi:ribonuclease PH
LPTWPLKNFVAAVSVGIYKDKPVLDLSYLEDKVAQADINVVMTGAGKLIEIQGTAEGRPFSQGELNKLIRLASHGIKQVVKAQALVLRIPT